MRIAIYTWLEATAPLAIPLVAFHTTTRSTILAATANPGLCGYLSANDELSHWRKLNQGYSGWSPFRCRRTEALRTPKPSRCSSVPVQELSYPRCEASAKKLAHCQPSTLSSAPMLTSALRH
jgi:hypothetical protein